MASAIDICNLALANLGDSASLTSLDPPDGSAQAEHCAIFYPMARDTFLELHPWSWMVRRSTLVEVAELPVPGWAYTYAMPNLAARILAVTPLGGDDATRYDFVVETLTDGSEIIRTNAPTASCRYTVSATDPTRWSQLFSLAVAWQLASMLAGPLLRGDTGIAQAKKAAQMATAYFERAKDADVKSGRVTPAHLPPWIAARS